MAKKAYSHQKDARQKAVALTDLCGQVLWQHPALTAVGSNQKAVLVLAEALIAEAIELARERAIPLLGLGVGVPGIVDPGPESLVSAPALGWKKVPLKQIWEQRFSLPVIVENKARAAAMAEALGGSAQGVTSFVYVSMGTDVHSSVEAAVVTDGLPYRGARGSSTPPTGWAPSRRSSARSGSKIPLCGRWSTQRRAACRRLSR